MNRPKSWFDAIHTDDRRRVLDASRTKQERGDYDETYRIVRPDGTLRWIRDRAFPVRDGEGKIYRIVGTAEDITERQQLEAEFIEAQKMEVVGQLAGGVAHDFNNILAVIMGYSELTDGETGPDHVLKNNLEMIRSGGRAGRRVDPATADLQPKTNGATCCARPQ